MALQTIVVPRICRSSSSSGAFRGSPCSGAANTAHCSNSSSSNNQKRSSYKEGQPAAAAETTAADRGHILYTVVDCKLKIVVLIKVNAQKNKIK